MKNLISKLIDIREDVDAIDHHQTNRIVSEIDEVIGLMKKSVETSESNTNQSPIKDSNPGFLNQVSFS